MAELGDLLWLECNAAELNGVSFTKGCFVGQENTARMNWRSKVNRRLFVVEGGGDPARTRVEYPELGLSVVHARLDAIPDNAIVPDWLQAVDHRISAHRERPHSGIFGGTAEKRKPRSGNASEPVICSQIGMSAPSSMVWTGRARTLVWSIL